MEPAVYPSSAVERAMKMQEVILRAIGGRLKWYQAAEILGISDRQMRRWKQRYERWGYDGLFDRRRLQIPWAAWRYSFAKCRVKVYEHLDRTLSTGHGPHALGHYDAQGCLLAPPSHTIGAAA